MKERLTRKQREKLVDVLTPYIEAYIKSMPNEDFDEWYGTSKDRAAAVLRDGFLPWLDKRKQTPWCEV